MSISTNDLKNGMALDLPQEGLVTVVEFQHVKPGKGGAFVRTKLKKVAGGGVLDRTFRADEKVPLAVIDKREMQYLYREGNAFVFMDSETYDQLHVEMADLGGTAQYLKEGDTAILMMYSGAWWASSSPPRSSSPSPRPNRAFRATACRVPASRRRWRPASSCRCRCSSSPGSA